MADISTTFSSTHHVMELLEFGMDFDGLKCVSTCLIDEW